ncbi:MAG TPA: TolC family protein [Pyrinomonadaceae bacterium]|nr:TolC family protein [Pyrinomonadaceae bacterium]
MKLFYRTAFVALVLSLSTGLCDLRSAMAQTPDAAPQIAKNAEVSTTEKPSEKSPEKVEKPVEKTVETRSVNILHRVGVQTAETLPLTLNEAIRRALENNNSIEVARDDVRFQETQLRSQLGIYDPVFSISPNLTRNSTTGSRATNDFRLNSDVSGLIRRGGGNYRVFFDNVRTENSFSQQQLSSGNTSTGGAGALFSSGLGVSYTQPLMRDFRIDNTRRQIRIQRRFLQQTDADFRRQTTDVIAQVQRGYWDLVFALRDQQNRVANLNLARENLRQVEAKIEAGTSAPVERAEVATELANREGEVLLATQQVTTAENNLKTLLLRDITAPEWNRSIVPTDRPVYSDEAIVLDDAIKDAVENRPELQRLKLAREINAINIEFFKNQTKPQVDLNTTFSLNGFSQGGTFSRETQFVPLISGDPQNNAFAFLLQQIRRFHGGLPTDSEIPLVPIPPTPSFLTGGFNRSFLNLFRSDAPNYTVGVTFSFPLRNRTARANLAGARVQEEQIGAQTRAQEQTIIADVRNAVQAVETARQRVLVARRARENAEIQLEGERKKYEFGSSSTFLLFQRENTLANARNAEIRAETDFNKALADLQRATSTTFRANNIEVSSPVDEK